MTSPLHPLNIAAIYTAAKDRLPWTVEQLRPYVVHSYADSTKPDTWFFDTFLLLDFRVRRGTTNAWLWTTSQALDANGNPSSASIGKKSDWRHLIESYFGAEGSTESVLSRLNDCIAVAKQELGTPSFKHRVFLAVPEPVSSYWQDGKRKFVVNPETSVFAYDWDDENNSGMYFTRSLTTSDTLDYSTSCDACDNALKWFVDECVARWNSAGLQHLELAGFYWVGEGRPGLYIAFDTFKHLREHLATNHPSLVLGVSFSYSVYEPNGTWNKNGTGTPYRTQCAGAFDYVFGQPNYSLGGGSEGRTALAMYEMINQAQQYVDGNPDTPTAFKTREGIVVEMNGSCLHDAGTGSLFPTRYCRVGYYLNMLAGKIDMNLVYYTAEGLLAKAYHAATNAASGQYSFDAHDYGLYDQLAVFVRNRRRTAVLSRADVTGDGNVGIEDIQLVTAVMNNNDTDPDHVARADVNRDGVVDIADVQEIARVMLNDAD